MAASVTQRKKNILTRDPQKEAAIRELSAVLVGAGYEVRREQLKQGYGWKVLSGSCTYREQRLVFLDRRLSQEDQISFLLGKILGLQISVQREQVPSLGDRTFAMLMPSEQQPPAAVAS